MFSDREATWWDGRPILRGRPCFDRRYVSGASVLQREAFWLRATGNTLATYHQHSERMQQVAGFRACASGESAWLSCRPEGSLWEVLRPSYAFLNSFSCYRLNSKSLNLRRHELSLEACDWVESCSTYVGLDNKKTTSTGTCCDSASPQNFRRDLSLWFAAVDSRLVS